MVSKPTELDVAALLSEAVFGHGFLHYGYWPEGRPATPSTQALGQAQQAYFDLMVSAFPPGVTRVLDVGSGTGANALALSQRGFSLELVCPSEQLNAMARAKLPPGTPVHTATFEDFGSPSRFDLCLFAESFHYIALAPALAQTARYATRGAVIFDYFRRTGRGDDVRGTHAEFLAEVARQGAFRVARDEDLTEAILPTFFVLDHLKNAHFGPFLARARAAFRARAPVKAWLAERVLGRAMDKFQRPSARESTFARDFEYRLVRLECI
jgi:SAM-dependent methyltransferase